MMDKANIMLRSVLRKFLPKSTVLAYRLRKELRASQGNIILVYQMAKVGSASVYRSLQDGLEIPAYHAHFLSAAGIQNAERFFKDAGAPVPFNIRYSAILRRHLSVMRPVIITLVRDPIAREISNYFQIGDRVFDARGIEAVLSEVSSRIRRLGDETSGNIVHRWFDSELKSVFGVDVYSQPFDFEKGYVVITGKRCTVILFRLEDLDRSFENGIHEVFGKQGSFELHLANVSNEKPYADLYREVKTRIRVDSEVCRAIYATRFGRHFYKDMAEELTRKWSRADE